MFNRERIKDLEQNVQYLTNKLEILQRQVTESNKTISKLSFLLNNPIKYKVGDIPFKNITITSIECRDSGDYNCPFWGWRVVLFDSKNKKQIHLKLDCGNNLINPNK